jgi:hypothetical protein
MRSTLSILGLYQYNTNIFDDMEIPDGLDKDVLIDNLLTELAEFEVLYPDAEFLQSLIGRWSRKELPVWQKLYNTTLLEYNPIHNYDRTEEWTDTTDVKQNVSGTSDANDTADVQTKVAGYNDDELVDKNANYSTSTTSAKDNVDTTSNTTNVKNGRAYGNIGVTTTQQMIQAERDVVKFNIYDYIIESFKQRFCLLVY